MQPNGCIFIRPSQVTGSLKSRRADSVLQIKRARPEVDNPVMAPQDRSAEQSRHRLGTPKQIAMNETLEIDHAYVFADDIHRADREPPDAGDLHTALLQVNRRRTELRFMKRN